LDLIKIIRISYFPRERDVSEDFEAWRCARFWFMVGEWRE